MSIEAVQWALEIIEISPTAKHVLTVLAFRSDDKGFCWPSIPRIKIDTNLSKDSIIRGIKELQEKGYITIQKNNGGCNKYNINFKNSLPHQSQIATPPIANCEYSQAQDVSDTSRNLLPLQSQNASTTSRNLLPHQSQIATQKDQEKKEEKSKKDQSLPPTDVEGADADASARETEKESEIYTSKKKPKNRDDYDPEYVEFAEKYQAAVLKKYGNLAPPITESLICQCAKAIDLCVRKDKISFDELKDCLRWAFQDDFWGKQLRSLAAIRSTSKNGLKKIQNVLIKYKDNLQKKAAAYEAQIQQPTQTSPQQPTQQPATPTEWQYRQQEQRLQVDKYFRMKEELERMKRMEQEEDVNAK